jgi:hypothetical protein
LAKINPTWPALLHSLLRKFHKIFSIEPFDLKPLGLWYGVEGLVVVQTLFVIGWLKVRLKGTSWIMLWDMSDLDRICLFYITRVISVGLLIEYECKMHAYAKWSHYEILGLFITKYILGSRNIVFDYTKMTLLFALCTI